MKKTITLDIAGASYRMNVDANADEAHLRRLADIVNERVRKVIGPKGSHKAAPAQLLAMVALGLADDWLTENQRVRTVEDTTRRAIVNAIARIDRRLAADALTPADA